MSVPRMARFDRALLAAAVVTLVSAFALSPSKKVVFKKTAVVFSQWWEDEMDAGSLAALVAEFEAENPAIQVILDARGKDELGRLLEPGGPPFAADLVALDPYWINGLVKAGGLRPLDAGCWQYGDGAEDMPEEAREYAPEPPRYAVPLVSFVNLLFYNTSLLRGAGLDRPPKSREDFFEACKKISSGGEGAYAYALSDDVRTDCLPWFWQSPGALPQAGEEGLSAEAFLALPAARQAADFLASLAGERALAPYPFAFNEAEKVGAFGAGRAAMITAPVSAIRRVRRLNPELDFSVTAVPPPGNYSGRTVFNVQSWFAGIPAAGRNGDGALALLEFLSRRRAALARAAGALAPHADGAAAQEAAEDELYAKAKSLADGADIKDDYDVFGDLSLVSAALRAAIERH